MDKPRAVFRDYYYVLGLKPGASQGQIQAAYNELYEKFGPHVSAEELDPDAMSKAYRDISEAYEVLMDPARRREYDHKAEQSRQNSNDLRDLWLKKAGMQAGEAPPAEEHPPSTPSGWMKRATSGHSIAQTGSHPTTASGSHPITHDQPVSGRNEESDQHGSSHVSSSHYESSHESREESYLEVAQEAHDTPSQPPPAIALEVEMAITLKEAFKGCKKEVVIADPVACSECSGAPTVSRLQCSQCRGIGTYNIDRREELELEPGMYDGMEIVKPGQGRYDVRAGHNGDLIIKVKLTRHPLLGTTGKDITCAVPVTVYEAMLGAEIDVPCATGKVTMKIQPLTQPGRIYRLKGLGLGGADQLVTIEVVLPARLSAEEVSAYKKLREMFHEPNPREKYFQQP